MKGRHLFLIAGLFLSTACEDWLDKMPLDKLYPDAYFNTAEELELFTNSLYPDILPGAASLYEESADAIIISVPIDEVTGQRQIPANGGGWEFQALRDINFFLQYSGNCEDSGTREQYDAVARFFRAYFYFEKIKRFGDVPWYDRVLESTDPDLYKPRDSREFVMTKILEDVDYAIAKLPDTKDCYRVTRWSALALKSRMCLFEGTFRKYHGLTDYEKYLDECIEASDEFISQSGYGIDKSTATPYYDLFASENAVTSEVVLARDYSKALNLFHNVQNYENSPTTGAPGLNKKIVNSYLMKDGSRFTDQPGYETMTFAEECQNRDPRLAQTIRTPGYKFDGKPAAPNLQCAITGYHLIKYTMDNSENGFYKKSVNDMPIFRAAEVYLNFAEAKAERGTLEQDDLDRSVNKLRDRVGMPDMDMEAANLNPDPYLSAEKTGYLHVSGENKGVILEIRRERTIELIMEGHRYWDIMRWAEGKLFERPMLGFYVPVLGAYDLDGDGKDDVHFWKGSKPAEQNGLLLLEVGKQIELTDETEGNILLHGHLPRTWNEDRDYLYPIPSNQRVLTGGKLSQNPGWNDGLIFD